MQTFVIDFRENPLGEESFASAMLYPLRARGQFTRMDAPQGYLRRAELRRLTRNLHMHLQRDHTESEQWGLVVLLDQSTEKDPAWGSLSHQFHALRAYILNPLDDTYGQKPALTLGILPDYWSRSTQTQIPESPEAFLQWGIDRFGMLRVNSLQGVEDSAPVSEAALSRHPHLLAETDEPTFTDASAQDVRNFFEEKIKACKSFHNNLEEQFDVSPPAWNPRELVGIRDRLLDHLDQAKDKRTPWAVFQDQAKRHLSALGGALYRQRRDLVLLRVPVNREPLPRRKRDIMRLDYVQGACSLPSGLELRDSLLGDDDIFAYWFGTRQEPDQSSQIDLSEDHLCDSVQRNLAHLQEAKLSLDRETLGSYQLELFEPFDHSCDLEDSDDWKGVVERLNEFSFLRSAAATGRWSGWVEEVDGLVNEKYDRLSSKLSTCLTEARQEWKDQTTRTEEGEDIERKVAELEKRFERKRGNVFDQRSEGFVNDWEERADALADSVRHALQLRPTRQQFVWILVGVLTLLALLLTGTVSTFPSRAWPIGFWGVFSLLLGALGLFLARKRLFSQIRRETQRATREAENVIDDLHTFIESRETTIENYFETLATRKNLERARRTQNRIEAERLHRRYHQQSLLEHADEAVSLRDFLRCSSKDIGENSSSGIDSPDIERLDAPPFCSPVYALKRPSTSKIEVLGTEVEGTDFLPGLQKISVEADPAFHAEVDSAE